MSSDSKINIAELVITVFMTHKLMITIYDIKWHLLAT